MELTREWTQRTLAHVDRTRNIFYKVHALRSLVWVYSHTGKQELAQACIQEGLGSNLKLPNPLQFMILGPALALEVQNRNWELAINHVKSLLLPNQQKLPNDVQSMLEQAIACWETDDIQSVELNLEQSLTLMQQKQLGYA